MPEEATAPSVPAVDRALDILETIAESDGPLSTAGLQAHVDGSRSGLYSLIGTLRRRGYIQTVDGRHELGAAAIELASNRSPIVETLLEAFRRDIAPLDETIALVMFEGGRSVVVGQRQSDRPLRVVFSAGDRIELGAEASFLGDWEPPEDFMGIAIASSDGRTEIAAPICQDGVEPIAALVVAVPNHRASSDTIDRIGVSVRQSAALLSHRLGAVVYQPFRRAETAVVESVRSLTDEEIEGFLDGLWGAQLACVRQDGTPHLIPLWYEWDSERMWMAASPGASWATHVLENPRVSVTLDEPWAPLRRVFVIGNAAEVPDGQVPGGVSGLRDRLARRYLGKGASVGGDHGWRAFTVTPETVTGRQGLGLGAAAR